MKAVTLGTLIQATKISGVPRLPDSCRPRGGAVLAPFIPSFVAASGSIDGNER